jgi:catechol 2,3-dioxygenase-like lactoylglutathione lyase family enzyme
VNNLYARSVFFVKDAERSLRFYTETLGFSLEWKHEEQGRVFVFEVSLLGDAPAAVEERHAVEFQGV